VTATDHTQILFLWADAMQYGWCMFRSYLARRLNDWQQQQQQQ
jgi:hypothetical protein